MTDIHVHDVRDAAELVAAIAALTQEPAELAERRPARPDRAGVRPVGDTITSCRIDDRRSGCQAFRPGHHMHHIHARHVGQSPWGWRDAIVTIVDAGTVTLSYLSGGATVRVWHHRGLGALLAPGEPVRVHEGLHALGLPAGWFNVAVLGGIGAVPAPTDVAAWREQRTWGVVDLQTGTGLPLDYLEP